MRVLLYETPGHKDKWLKTILLVPVIIIIIPGLFALVDGDMASAVGMLGVAAFVALVMLFIIPRKYCIFDDRIKILFGGPFAFSIPFSTIETAQIPHRVWISINLPSSLSSSHAVQIVRKKRMSVIITPHDRLAFLENLNIALRKWLQYRGGV